MPNIFRNLCRSQYNPLRTLRALREKVSTTFTTNLNMPKLKRKKMLLHGAIGDAYGAGFEFAPMEKIRQYNTISRYEQHPIFPEIQGKYTDDTQMSIAIAELLINNIAWTPENIADKFVECFKRDPRRGYAKRFYQFLTEIKDGAELLQKIHPKSERNGAAMRAYPLGILKDELEIKTKCRMQAGITHQTEKAMKAAEAIALTCHFFIHKKGEKDDLGMYLSDIQQYKWNTDWDGEVGVDALQTVEAVLTVLEQETTLTNMLKRSVNFGGDVDTVASLTLAIGSLMPSVQNDLPKFLYDDLENGAYGRDYMRKLDELLFKMSK